MLHIEHKTNEYTSICFCCQSPALAPVEEDGYSECGLVWKLMSLLFQMMLSFDIADIATAMLILISYVEVPSLLKVDSGFLFNTD